MAAPSEPKCSTHTKWYILVLSFCGCLTCAPKCLPIFENLHCGNGSMAASSNDVKSINSCVYIYIQVVPGQAGGGSFKREKDLYSKERICL